MAKFVKRPSASANAGIADSSELVCGLLAVCPALGEHLTLAVWDDGNRRATSTILIFCDEGRLKACLTDRDAGRVAFVSSIGIDGLFAALEKGLVDGTLDWRVQREKSKARKA